MSASRRSAVFAPGSAAIAAARELVWTTLDGWALPPATTEDAVLVADELMTNAVVHAGAEIELACELDAPARRVRIEVRDRLTVREPAGAGPVRHPDSRGRGDRCLDGRGLLVTHSLTDAWGVTYTKSSKTVWFEIGLPEHVGAAAHDDGEPGATADQGYRGWLGFLTEAADLLAGQLDEKLVLALAAQLFVPRIASWCAVYLEDRTADGQPAHVWHADEGEITSLRRALGAAPSPVPCRGRGIRPWAGAEALGPEDRRICGPHVLELPLACREARIGVILLGGPGGAGFHPDLARLAEDVGDRVAQALLTARRYGAQAAASQILQRSLLPAKLPEIPDVDYSIVYAPTGEGAAAGGDFYDIYPSGPGRWRFMFGDVCGTGPEAAAVTGLVRHTLRALSREGHTAASALNRLNETVLEEGEPPRLLTVLHGELETRATGGLRLSVAAAGHPLPLRLHPCGKVVPIGTPQVMLGAMADPGYRLDAVELVPGDLVLCVTDGVTERRDGNRQLDDEDGLARLLAGCTGLTARAVALRVQSAVRDFTDDPLNDDMAILTFKVR